MPSRREIVVRILVATGSIVIACLCVEAAVRLLGIGTRFHVIFRENFQLSDNPVITYELVPGSPDGEFKINSAGMRGPEVPVQKPEGVFRIAVIGDSVTFGFKCSRDKTYASRLEAELNQNAASGSVRFEVLNFGVLGYNISQVAETLRVRVDAFDPDLVIYGYVLNDPQLFSLEGDSLKLMQAKAEESLDQKVSRGMDRFLRHSQVYLLLRQRSVSPPAEPALGAFDPTYHAHREGSAIDYLRTLHDQPETWKHVIDGMASLANIQGSHSSPSIAVAIFPVDYRDGSGLYALQDVHARIGAEAERSGLAFIDLASVFHPEKPGRRLFLDFLHPNQRGHALAAKALRQWLVEAALIPGPRPRVAPGTTHQGPLGQ